MEPGKLYAAEVSEKAEATLNQALLLGRRRRTGESISCGHLRSLVKPISSVRYDEAKRDKGLSRYTKSLGRNTGQSLRHGRVWVLLRKMRRKPEASEAEKRAKKIRSAASLSLTDSLNRTSPTSNAIYSMHAPVGQLRVRAQKGTVNPFPSFFTLFPFTLFPCLRSVAKPRSFFVAPHSLDMDINLRDRRRLMPGIIS